MDGPSCGPQSPGLVHPGDGMNGACTPRMKRFFLFSAMVSLVACESTATGGSGGGTGGTGSGGTGGTGGTTITEVPCTDCLGTSVSWSLDGGLVQYEESMSLGDCRTFTYQRTTFGSPPDGPSGTCTVEIGGCDAAKVAVHDVEQALAHPDVVAALAAPAALYGEDDRCVDGVLLMLDVGGVALKVGSECSGMPACADGGDPCVPVPPGLDALRTVLRDVKIQSLKEGECATMFP